MTLSQRKAVARAKAQAYARPSRAKKVAGPQRVGVTGVHIVTPPAQGESQQGLAYFEGISAQTAGSTGLCLHRLVVPPGGRARAHLHARHESGIYVISGDVRMFWGDALQFSANVHSGDFIYIPPGMPHVPCNLSETTEAVGLVARTDPNEQENVILMPELDALLRDS